MASSWINSLGIVVSTTGTILTLWTLIAAPKNEAGTWGEFAKRHTVFPKEQWKARIGCVLIAIGGVIQIAGQFF